MNDGYCCVRRARLAWAGAIVLVSFSLGGCGLGSDCATTPPGSQTATYEITLPDSPTEPTAPTEETAPTLPPAPALPTGPTYDLDDTLQVNEIQMKGSHNSYHIRPNNGEPAWNYDLPPIPDQLENLGVRAFELDLHYYGGRFPVFHLPDWDQRSTCPFLEDCLGQIRDWSAAHPGHSPLFLFFEFKDESDPLKIADHLEELEQVLVDNYPRKMIFTPDDLTGKLPDVQSAIRAHGWPKLGAMRGKIVMVMHAFGLAPHRYTNGGNGLWGRRMFVSAVNMNDRHAGILAQDEAVELEGTIRTMVAKGFIVRTRSDDLPTFGGDRWGKYAAALRGGAQIILTDYPEPWYIDGYNMIMPGGKPVRCNPVTAPREPGACTAEGIENPLLLVNPLYYVTP